MKNEYISTKEEEFDTSLIYQCIAIPVAEIYYNEDSVWGVYELKTETKLPYAKESIDIFTPPPYKSYSYFKLTGKMQKLVIGTEYNLEIKLTHHQKYGYSFVISSISQDLPKTYDSQKNFLLSICTEGQVKTLLESYPNLVEEVIAGTDNVDVNKLYGIKDFYWNLIKKKILENYIIADLLSFLTPYGVSYNKIKTLLKNEENPYLLKQMLLEDPYILTEIHGISFKTADELSLKIRPDLRVSDKRTISFIKDYMKSVGEDEGHTWIDLEILRNEISNNLIECKDIFDQIIDEEKNDGKFLRIEKNKIGLDYYNFVETEIWRIIKNKSLETPLEISQNEIDEGIQDAEKIQGFNFTEEQKQVLITATKSNFNIITGKAGSGKTTLARGLLNIYKNRHIGACALSAKAAKRINETTGFQAMTIHRLLGAQGINQFFYDEISKMPYEVIFVDESSMIYGGLFYYLLRAVKPDCKVILCGDSAQLPPIGWGNIFSDLLEKQNLQINYLTKIMRQAEASGIISDANKIRNGLNPIDKPALKEIHGELQDMIYAFREDRNQINKLALNSFMRSVEEEGLDNVFILVPRKNDVVNSTFEINKKVQDLLLSENLPSITHGLKTFRLGCRIIHTVNNYDKNVMNGEVGYVTSAGYIGKSKCIEVTYPDKPIVLYTDSEINEIELAYALTTHKFQGSEANTIVTVIDNSHFMLLDNCYLYTTITRAKKRCLLIAEPYAFKTAVLTNKSIARQTWLKDME